MEIWLTANPNFPFSVFLLVFPTAHCIVLLSESTYECVCSQKHAEFTENQNKILIIIIIREAENLLTFKRLLNDYYK